MTTSNEREALQIWRSEIDLKSKDTILINIIEKSEQKFYIYPLKYRMLIIYTGAKNVTDRCEDLEIF